MPPVQIAISQMKSFNDLCKTPTQNPLPFTSIPIVKATTEDRVSRFASVMIAYAEKVAKEKELSAGVTVKSILSPSPSLRRQEELNGREHYDDVLKL